MWKSANCGFMWWYFAPHGLVLSFSSAFDVGIGPRNRTLEVWTMTRFFGHRESGQGLAEYALILALIAIAAVLALLFLSGTIQSILSIIGDKL
jgi:pilus assembly protein Flp/PilA